MKRLTYLLLCLFASIAFATAQTTKVTGTVISAEDDGPIIGASIVVAGTTTGTVTDYNGAFTLDVPSNAKKANRFLHRYEICGSGSKTNH
ncbi:carboxypeptidase-like regulatory domain-containing protein [Parabacteroides distasonis]|uniref:carboxypeptidase-like regulatory domain-containing protein n=1 Tax=Parabacteroides distasonis TaxID=823 RepID=UPI0021640052|nr:carboxypeptidase-like regulatory domain-containing protein [Parabacteroides distasonis]UVR12606.1 carboxypeptidase-like regulatory domain-containing protein [Parabacteroides distasonis]